MKKIIFFLLILFQFVGYVYGQKKDSVSKVKPAFISGSFFESEPSWTEDFNTDGFPNPKYWTARVINKAEELECYTKDSSNVFVKGGNLVLQTIKQHQKNKEYTSGYVDTYSKQSFLYGKLEVCAKLPTGKGIWPGIWMLSEDRNTYPRGEIDIMEYIDHWKGQSYQVNAHTLINKDDRKQHCGHPRIDVTEPQIYGLEWYKDSLVFTLNHKSVYKYNKDNPDGWPFDKAYYLILNVAYGGWGTINGKVDDSILPCKMNIDWIKYYKLKD